MIDHGGVSWKVTAGSNLEGQKSYRKLNPTQPIEHKEIDLPSRN